MSRASWHWWQFISRWHIVSGHIVSGHIVSGHIVCGCIVSGVILSGYHVPPPFGGWGEMLQGGVADTWVEL